MTLAEQVRTKMAVKQILQEAIKKVRSEANKNGIEAAYKQACQEREPWAAAYQESAHHFTAVLAAAVELDEGCRPSDIMISAMLDAFCDGVEVGKRLAEIEALRAVEEASRGTAG